MNGPTIRYELHGWHVQETTGDPRNALDLRPGLATLCLRLRITAWAGILAAVVLAGGATISRAPAPRAAPLSTPADEAVRKQIDELGKRLSPEGQREIEQKDQARQERFTALNRRQQRRAAIVWWTAAAVAALLVAMAILAPLSLLWNRLRLACPDPATLEITGSGLWRRVRRLPLAEYGSPALAQLMLTSANTSRLPPSRMWCWVLALPPLEPRRPRIEYYLLSTSSPRPWGQGPEFAELTTLVERFCTLVGCPLLEPRAAGNR
jgi:hypothetical protein